MEEVDIDFLKIIGKKAKINIEDNIDEISIKINKLIKLISKLDNINK